MLPSWKERGRGRFLQCEDEKVRCKPGLRDSPGDNLQSFRQVGKEAVILQKYI